MKNRLGPWDKTGCSLLGLPTLRRDREGGPWGASSRAEAPCPRLCSCQATLGSPSQHCLPAHIPEPRNRGGLRSLGMGSWQTPVF